MDARLLTNLVLLPGMDGTGELFAPLVSALNRNCPASIIYYPSTASLGYEALTNYVRARLPREGNFVLLGESFSGPAAIAVAADEPSGLKGLILCCSFARSPQPLLKYLRLLLPLIPLRNFPMRLLAYPLLGDYSTPARQEALRCALSQVSPQVLRERAVSILSADATASLRRVRAPILVLTAREDRVVPRSASAAILQCASHARLVELPGPHLLLQVRPNESARIIEDFVARVALAEL